MFICKISSKIVNFGFSARKKLKTLSWLLFASVLALNLVNFVHHNARATKIQFERQDTKTTSLNGAFKLDEIEPKAEVEKPGKVSSQQCDISEQTSQLNLVLDDFKEEPDESKSIESDKPEEGTFYVQEFG